MKCTFFVRIIEIQIKKSLITTLLENNYRIFSLLFKYKNLLMFRKYSFNCKQKLE